MRSLPEILFDLLHICQAGNPWARAYCNEINLVGAVFEFHGHEIQVQPMRLKRGS
jgi:hypothetical protein